MKKFLVLSLIMTAGFTACGGAVSLDSLCVLEIPHNNPVKLDQIVCWTDKEQGEGLTLLEINEFFALNEVDLRKVTAKLEECEQKK